VALRARLTVATGAYTYIHKYIFTYIYTYIYTRIHEQTRRYIYIYTLALVALRARLTVATGAAKKELADSFKERLFSSGTNDTDIPL
jgi:hypothetical protein